MPFDWTKFLTLAQELATRVDDASRRSAVSRAYYSAFNVAYQRAILTAGNRPSDQSSHSWCWRKYTATNDKSCRRIGIIGERMKRLRVDADYKADDDPRIEDAVRRVLEEAQDCLARISVLDRSYPLP
jgi:uncharacterized protein (UPF0332 family)